MRIRQDLDSMQSQIVDSRELCHKKEALIIELRLLFSDLDLLSS